MNHKLLFAILILIPVFLAYGIRMQGTDMPVTDGWAASTVYSYYSNQVRAQVEQQYPNLPESNKQKLIDDQMRTQVYSNPQIHAQIAEASQQFKNAYKYEGDKYFYMPDIDPYEYLKETEDILKHGHIGDVKKEDGYWYNMHSLAPIGNKIYVQDLHPVVLTYWHKLMRFFNRDIPVMQSLLYVPVVFSALATMFVFLTVRVFAGNIGGLFGAALYGIHPVVLSRTLWGHADTDIWQILFIPMIICFATLMIVEQSRKRYIYASLAGLAIGLFSSSWSQWYYAFDLLLGALGMFAVIVVVKNWKAWKSSENPTLRTLWQMSVKPLALTVLVFLLVSGIFVSLIGVGGWRSFFDAPFVVFSNFAIKDPSFGSLWPNVYTTVAELSPIGLSGIVGLMGKIWIALAGAGVVIALLKREWFIALVVMLFSIAGIVASLTAGTRFVMFVAMPVSIGVGLALGWIHKYATEWTVKAI